jgi:hypothetical protein
MSKEPRRHPVWTASVIVIILAAVVMFLADQSTPWYP